MPVSKVASDLRQESDEPNHQALLALCRKIIEAYAELHGHGVIYGDVHGGNVIATPKQVYILDFGYATAA